MERTGKGWRADLTHCKRDHEFTEENTLIFADGRRRCRACIRENERRRWRAGLDAEREWCRAEYWKAIALAKRAA